jgi:hypothetical protein
MVLVRTVKISWTDHVKNGKVLQRVKGESNIVYTIEKEARLTGLVTSFRGITFWKTLLEEK